MSEPEEIDGSEDRPKVRPPEKKAYQKPAFRFERVFETRALACGKVNVTNQQCANNRKTS